MTHSPDEASTLGIYLYCLAKPDCLAVVKGLADQGVHGVDERYPISSLEQNGLVAVIGEVDAGEFHDRNLQALPWVGPRACRHEALVERIMRASPVMPVKFGTIFQTITSLQGLLVRHRETIAQCLDTLQGKAEWSVKGYLDDTVARQHVAAADPAIQAKLAARSASPGARYFQQKLVEAMIDSALRTWIERLTGDVEEALETHAVETTGLKLLSGTATGRSERMIFNRGYLVSEAARPGFHAAVAEQAAAHRADGVTLDVRGPWPPYNFCPDLSAAEPHAGG